MIQGKSKNPLAWRGTRQENVSTFTPTREEDGARLDFGAVSSKNNLDGDLRLFTVQGLGMGCDQ